MAQARATVWRPARVLQIGPGHRKRRFCEPACPRIDAQDWPYQGISHLSFRVCCERPPEIRTGRKLRSEVCWPPRTRRTDLSKRRNHAAAFKPRVALEALKAERAMSSVWPRKMKPQVCDKIGAVHLPKSQSLTKPTTRTLRQPFNPSAVRRHANFMRIVRASFVHHSCIPLFLAATPL